MAHGPDQVLFLSYAAILRNTKLLQDLLRQHIGIFLHLTISCLKAEKITNSVKNIKAEQTLSGQGLTRKVFKSCYLSSLLHDKHIPSKQEELTNTINDMAKQTINYFLPQPSKDNVQRQFFSRIMAPEKLTLFVKAAIVLQQIFPIFTKLQISKIG